MRIDRLGGFSGDESENRNMFGDDLRAAARLPDDDLADLIVEYGLREHPTDLGVFLRAIPGLEERLVALDAAIEMVLRGRCRRGATVEQACESLIREHPHLAKPIRTAAALNRIMTDAIDEGEAHARDDAALPRLTRRFLNDRQPRYSLHERIGDGSEAVVYLAVDRAFSDPEHPAWVAVKRSRLKGMAASLGDSDESERARRVVHPNVVRVLDRFVDDAGRVCHVFEYIRGGTLASWRNSLPGRVSTREAAKLVRQIAHGVQAIHAVGLVHRDLKPTNVLMTESGIPKVTDFGISRPQETGFGVARQGSLAFVAPEQFRGGSGAVTVAADVYGLGGLLYWLLTDRYPNASLIDGGSGGLNQMGGTAPSPSAVRNDIDSDLDAICRRALAPHAHDRYASADALALDLERWLAYEPLSWHRTPLHRRVSLAFRRHPRALPAACAGVALGIGGLLVGVAAWGEARLESARLEFEAERQAREAQRLQELGVRTKAVEKVIELVMNRGNPDSPSNSWLNAVTFVETVLGPMLIDSERPIEAWKNRIEVARRLVNEAAAAGRRDHIETMLLEACLCVWLLQDQQTTEAATRLAHLRDRWTLRCAPEDPWLTQLRIMELCAKVMDGGSDGSDERRGLLREAEALSRTLPVRPVVIQEMLQLAERQLGVAQGSR
jgi:hypothetical protein